MKKLLVTMIILAVVSSFIFAGSSWIGPGGSLSSESRASVNIGFDYDASTMHRITFGFTEDSEITWNGPSIEYSSKSYPLQSDYSVGSGAKGVGNLNFYWILRTPDAITAKLYLEKPMHDSNLNKDLDWKIVFNTNSKGSMFYNNSIDSKYGIENAVEAFSKDADVNAKVCMGSVPLSIETYKVEEGYAYNFTGTIGVLIENS